jgi:hypothetical protein
MASLALTSPPSVKIPSYLSSSSSSLFSRSSISFRTTESRSRICVSGYAVSIEHFFSFMLMNEFDIHIAFHVFVIRKFKLFLDESML